MSDQDYHRTYQRKPVEDFSVRERFYLVDGRRVYHDVGTIQHPTMPHEWVRPKGYWTDPAFDRIAHDVGAGLARPGPFAYDLADRRAYENQQRRLQP